MTDLELRRWSTADAADLHAAVRQSSDLSAQLGGAELGTVAECADFIAAHLDDWGAVAYNFAISVAGVAVGNIGLSNVERAHDTAWVYYWIAVGMRGRGLPSRGLASVAYWAFTELALFRLELGHRVNNPASCRVAVAAGFAAEGVERAKLRHGTERFDVETHARLRTDPPPGIPALPLAATASCT